MRKDIHTYVYTRDVSGTKKGTEIKTTEKIAKALISRGDLELKKEGKKSKKENKED